jgi:arsenical pump membrane protein
VTDLEQARAPAQVRGSARWFAWALLAVGCIAGATAALTHVDDARAAGSQDWPPFVLVAGLLLVGLVAQEDGLFTFAGNRLAHAARSGIVLYIGAVAIIAVVTATLNLDTSVAFLTPVLIYTARSRGEDELPLLLACILLSNAASLFLPGSNLTNLIVLGHFNINGGTYLSHMWPSATAALVVTAAVIAVFTRRSLQIVSRDAAPAGQMVGGLGLAGVLAVTVLVIALAEPAVPVLCVGVAVIGIRVVRGRETVRRAVEVLGIPILLCLFGLAVGLGTLGRVWSGPSAVLAHLDSFGTAATGAVSSVLVNNLPAASLLAARTPPHPYSLLIGLNLGPNLFVTGSLAWILWLRAARSAHAHPSIRGVVRVGVVAVPLSIAASVGVLLLTGSR